MGRGDRRGAQGADTAGRSVCSLRSSKIDGDGGRWEDRGGPEPSQGVAGGAVVRAGPAHERPSSAAEKERERRSVRVFCILCSPIRRSLVPSFDWERRYRWRSLQKR
ncbi:hypothetical protein BHE74_00015691 [Ensete ventricosum]|nr:hypothetical protein BHE74_00015691 [Ensete ventricosum]